MSNINASRIVVRKRDGRIVPFDQSKIEAAVLGAFEDVDGTISEYAKKRARNIAEYIKDHNEGTLDVENIQNQVQAGLMNGKRPDVASAFVIYRYQHELMRKEARDKAFESKLLGTQIDNQNANVDEHSFGGRMGEANSVNLKDYALYHCMSKMARENHLNNEIYIHDLDQYSVGSTNCLTIPFDKLLANGFTTRQTDVRAANSINTAFQLIAVIFQIQSLMQFG